MAARVLLIGIDGASPTWLDARMADGELPELARLREAGCFGPLCSTPNMTSPSAWTSIATGVNPGRHGIFGFFDRVPGTYRFRPSDARARAAEPWWVIASRAGLRTATLNVPCSWPADRVDGLQIAGWLTPSPLAPGFTHPPELARELAGRFGDYPLHSDIQRLVATRRYAAARDRIIANLRRKAEIACDVLARERWDVASVVFTDTDAAQHYFWHLTDAAHPEHDPAMRADVGDVVLAAYREIDRALPGLLDAAGDPDVVLIVSDHGAGPDHRGHLYLPALLDALGRQVRRRRPLRRVIAAAQRLLPAGFKHRLAARAQATGRDLVSRMLVGDIVWPRTRAFTAVHGGRADVWLNVEGREPEGALSADEADRLADELRDTLMQCRDVETGAAVIAGVHDREAVYDGPHVELAPDLLVEWREDAPPLGGLRCGELVVTRAEGEQLHTGAHRRDGVVMAAGRGIRSGDVEGAGVEDIAPTLLHLCGLAVPGYCDGGVIDQLFDEAPRVAIDTRARLGSEGRGAGETDLRVADRLRGLGYL